MAVAFPSHMKINNMAVSKVQRLYDACDVVFSSPAATPTLGDITWLQSILDGMEAADVGIDDGENPTSDDELSPKSERRQLLPAPAFTRITYVHIHQCDDFSIGVFCFPAGATLPLHDHPEMVVLSKLLYGSVRVRSYDWVTTPSSSPSSSNSKCGLARVVAADEVRRAPCRATVLFPRSGGNLHAFTAVTPCAILDVLTPPYSEDHGRPSTYYADVPVPSSLPAGFAVLEETDLPEDFAVAGAPYLGPELITVDDDMDEDDNEDYDDSCDELVDDADSS